MLSRTAERLYWIGRYMERAENNGRMVSAVTEMILGSPKEAKALWTVVVEVMGLKAAYVERYGAVDERHVVRMLLADELEQSSIFCSVMHARENARTTREILPTEAWELINDSYWHVKEHAARGVTRNHRSDFLRDVIERCQLFNGMLGGTMSHDATYDFTRLGRKLERADMTTRVLDLGAAGLEAPGTEQAVDTAKTTPLSNVRWMSVLLCMSALQMYHQHVQTRINARDVARFLMLDREFPRSVYNCLNEVESCLKKLPHSEPVLNRVQPLCVNIEAQDIAGLLGSGLRSYLDRLQVEFGEIHQRITATWFTFDPK